jgi:hypothetical protein
MAGIVDVLLHKLSQDRLLFAIQVHEVGILLGSKGRAPSAP